MASTSLRPHVNQASRRRAVRGREELGRARRAAPVARVREGRPLSLTARACSQPATRTASPGLGPCPLRQPLSAEAFVRRCSSGEWMLITDAHYECCCAQSRRAPDNIVTARVLVRSLAMSRDTSYHALIRWPAHHAAPRAAVCDILQLYVHSTTPAPRPYR